MNRDIADIASGAILLLGAMALYAYTADAGYRMGDSVAFDAGLMPRLWLSIAAVCAAAMIARGMVGRFSNRSASDALSAIRPARVAVAFGLTAVFVAAFSYLGFWLPILVFVPAFSLAFGYRNPLVILLSTLTFAGATWLVFAVFLEVQISAFPEFPVGGG